MARDHLPLARSSIALNCNFFMKGVMTLRDYK